MPAANLFAPLGWEAFINPVDSGANRTALSDAPLQYRKSGVVFEETSKKTRRGEAGRES